MSAMKRPAKTAPTANPHRRRAPPRKTDIVLAAAEQAFIELGYAGTSVDAIAERAGVSKRTVYNNFSPKQVLYDAVVKKVCMEVVPTAIDSKLMDMDPEKTLLGVSVAFLEGIYQPRQVAFYQTVVADARQFPDAGKMLFDGPIMRTQDVFDLYFRRQAQRGAIAVEGNAPRLDSAVFDPAHLGQPQITSGDHRRKYCRSPSESGRSLAHYEPDVSLLCWAQQKQQHSWSSG